MAELNEWLGVGGASSNSYGSQPIEARICLGGNTWVWRRISRDKLLAYLNQHPEDRDGLLEPTN